jgi:hypothetical protein
MITISQACGKRSAARLLAAATISFGVAVTGLVTGCSVQVAGSASPAADGAPPAAEPGTIAVTSAADAPTGSLPDACTLLTLEEATKLAGTPLDPATPAGAGDAVTLCQYTGPTSGPVAQVEVYVGDGAKQILDTDRRIGHTINPLPATGDEAYEEDGNVFVRKGDVWAAVRLVRLNDPSENRDPLRAAAKIVVGRL